MTKTLPTTPFGDDDGAADPQLAAALSAYERGDGGPADVLAALAGARLLMPVVAVRDDQLETPDQPVVGVPGGADEPGAHASDVLERVEKSTTMAVASTIGRDGRRGLLAFTSVDSMRRWNPEARPSPVSTRAAAESALADGADALVIDLAGPVLFSIDAAGLRTLASGWRSVVS